MANILVEEKGADSYHVTVEDKSTTTHTVTLDPAYYQKLTGGKASEAELIKRSFEFLLERESNTMILSRFDLPLINRYFPEYERTISSSF